MKKSHLIIPGFIVFLALILFSCQKKSNSGVNPGYKEIDGTGGNPFVTVTGTPTQTNPAIQNSQLNVGGTGWNNPTCASSVPPSTILRGINGQIEIILSFYIAPTTGTYAIAGTPSPNQTCSMIVNNAPNQPTGVVWYAKSGVVNVTATSTGITASFSGIPCTQQDFTFPTVTVNGVVACN